LGSRFGFGSPFVPLRFFMSQGCVPITGDYQIRRGTISAELISARRTIQNALGEDMAEIDEL